MFNETYLRRTIEIVGIDRVLFSTDYPYQYRPGREARRFLDEMRLDDQSKRKFAYANWERLTNRPSV
jgi:predicted TIM-barrel fold metal-dependent hydrolase